MDLGSFSIGVIVGSIIGIPLGVGIILMKLRNAFKRASNQFQGFFDGCSVENVQSNQGDDNK